MESKKVLVRAVRTLLRPIVRLMIALGLNARDFIEITKTVYVEVATQEYGNRGRRANMSKVAVLTGLTRREVSRLRVVSAHDPLDLQDPMVPIGRVLATWHQDARFLNDKGEPRTLHKEREFLPLVTECSGDIPPTAVIRELEQADAIRMTDGFVEANARYFMPFDLDEPSIERFGRVVGDVSGAIVNNMLTKDRADSQFEGRAVNESVTFAAADAFRRYVDRRGQEFLEEMDDWLTDHADQRGDQEVTRMGIGIYMIRDIS